MINSKVLAIQYDPKRVIFHDDGTLYLRISEDEMSIHMDIFDEKGSAIKDTLSKELIILNQSKICLTEVSRQKIVVKS